MLCQVRRKFSAQTSTPPRYDGPESNIYSCKCFPSVNISFFPFICHCMLRGRVRRGDDRWFCHCFDICTAVHVRPGQQQQLKPNFIQTAHLCRYERLPISRFDYSGSGFLSLFGGNVRFDNNGPKYRLVTGDFRN